ncbi:hypothetical protein HMPREF1985_01041 [Mitsuokella sp. oral taxon 131 str. W9106]|nr:hypothetical protein HMPREF1985_01041 [Mitsuokella sp. oral taxon 131 str. W9106]
MLKARRKSKNEEVFFKSSKKAKYMSCNVSYNHIQKGLGMMMS